MSRWIKCNGLYKTEHYQKIEWCFKKNKKTISLRLATKEGDPCPYVFKYINCKENYLVDNYY